MQGKTKVKLGATAGLRLLPGGKADSILAAVKKYLQASPFLMDDKTGVTVLDGAVCSCPTAQMLFHDSAGGVACQNGCTSWLP